MHARPILFAPVAGLLLGLGSTAMAQRTTNPAGGRNTEPAGILADELALRSASLSSDGPALLDFFRKRTQTQVDPKVIEVMIGQLGDASVQTRERASAELVSLGPIVVPWLRLASKDADNQRVATRARRCLQWIEGSLPASGSPPAFPVGSYAGFAYPGVPGVAGPAPSTPIISVTAARVLAVRKPVGAADALLAYLPFADNESVLDEVKTALSSLAVCDGKAEPALLRALEDGVALRRVVAAEVLGQTAANEVRPLLGKLLNDPKPVVRLRIAVLLADLHDAEALAVLIALLSELPPSEAQVAEDYLLTFAGEHSPGVPLGADAGSRQKCRVAWAQWWETRDGAALLAELRKRTLPDTFRDRARLLIQKLGDDSFAEREKATTELMGMGGSVLPLIRQSVNSTDLEVSRRSQKILEVLDKEKLAPLSAVTLRMLAYRKPDGIAEVLLAYLPLAEEETMLAEVRAALTAVAARAGKPEPALVRALADPVPLRRALAAEALCRAGVMEQVEETRKLLHDPDPVVRLQAALARAGAGDREAIPVLVSLLGEVPPEQSMVAEEYLSRVAGGKAPNVRPGSDEASRKKFQTAWTEWWQTDGATLDPRRLQTERLPIQRQLGYTLIVLADNGEVVELSRDGKPRLQLTGLQGPADAQVLPNGRVLVAESQASRVTERNLKNEVVWEKQVNWPIGCQRLANGNTFIVTRNQLLEVDRNGRELFTHNRQLHDIVAAQKLRDGQIFCATSSGTCLRLDATGKEIKSLRLTGPFPMGGLDVLPNGRVLIPQTWTNKVLEFDGEGKAVWEATVQQPVSAVRLANGNTLVASQVWPPKVLELDRNGKTVWEHQPASRPLRAKRR